MRLDMIDHVAHLRRLNVASEAPEELIGAACGFVNDKVLCEAHEARVWAKSVTNASLCNYFLAMAIFITLAIEQHARGELGVVWSVHHGIFVIGHHGHTRLGDWLEHAHDLFFMVADRLVIIHFDCHI